MSGSIPDLPNLRLVTEIGSGGMSTVWKAMDLSRNEIVAVKILNEELTKSYQDIRLFVAEEEMMENLSHQGIVKSYGLNHFNKMWYYMMEYVDGYNFGSLLIRKQHLAEADCLLICESVASALAYAWNRHGLVHCDIKPENIMINTSGVVKLTDLGLCHIFDGAKDGKQEVPDQVLGTPAYISPEQVYGDVEPDCRADIYALAGTLYHLATGRVLFPGLSNEDMMRAHCSEEMQAKDPRIYRPQLTHGFCQLLEAMLVKDRDERVESWEDVLGFCMDIEKGAYFDDRDTPGISSLKLDQMPNV